MNNSNNILRNPRSIELVSLCNARVNKLIDDLNKLGATYSQVDKKVLHEKELIRPLLENALKILEQDTSITVRHNH